MPETLADQIEKVGHGLTADELGDMLGVSHQTIYRLAASKRILSFHIGSCVRFDPHQVAKWLRTQ